MQMISPSSDLLTDAQFLLKRVEEAAKEVGLDISPKKTEFMAFGEDGDLKTIENANIKKVLNFLYLEHGLAHPRQTSKFERQKHGQHSIKCMSSGSLV